MGKKNRKPISSTPTVKAPSAGVPPPAPAEPEQPHGFFTLKDWIAAAITSLISGLVFFYYMSPEVTLEDSGELVTGAFNFGVPHPPGYPLWAFLAWVWRHLVTFGNPAWRICLLSVLTGAMVVGVLTLLMTRSIVMLLRAIKWTQELDDSLKHWIALTVGSTSALLFGFNRGVWLWACVPEMRVLNVFMFIITACTFFAWMMRPQRHAYLYATILLYALGIANHQTIVVMALPFMVGAFAIGLLSIWQRRPWQMSVLMSSLSAFWELTVAALLGLSAGAYVAAWLQTPPNGAVMEQKINLLILFGPQVGSSALIFLPIAAAVVLLVWFGNERWLNRKTALICTAAFLLGCGFYFYMPVASSTNPPMNWGYAYTKQGFLHHITRGQYERINFSWPWEPAFWIQVRLFVSALIQQYTTVLSLFALGTLALLIKGWNTLNSRGRSWLIFVWVAFLTTSLGLLTIINPGLDKQNQEINIKFFAPAHGFFAMMIGYGLAVTVAWILLRRKNVPVMLVRLGCVALLALPLIPFNRNWRICEQRNHDFGYQFGYRMFYPSGNRPSGDYGPGDYPPMERDAVLYGGTDPGRFVPTYMIFCESRVAPKDRYQDPYFDPEGGKHFDRRDVYIITQNALADSTYMSYIRDHYDYTRPDPNNPSTLERRLPWQRALFRWGWHHLYRDTMYPKEPIWIPSEQDTQRAFQEYVQDVQNRQAHGERLSPDEQVSIEGGAVQVRGVAGVMKINGILTKWIFDRNKEKHPFYVEESYVIDWMYPYLTPVGIIMKINHDPLPGADKDPELWKKIVTKDREYWDKLCKDFEARPEFRRDSDAQKTFSKLRSAIGGVYAYRKLHAEAEYAFQQARQLCPESPEANFRLAQLYMELGRPDDALKVLQELQKLDPLNSKIASAINQISSLKQAPQDIAQLEAARQRDPLDLHVVMQLIQAYSRIGQGDQAMNLLQSYLTQTNLPAENILQVAQIYLSVGRIAEGASTLQLMAQRYPEDPRGYYGLAVILTAQQRTNDAIAMLTKAIELNPSFRQQAFGDQQFNALRSNLRFQQLVSPPPAPAVDLKQ
jgi:tetratricopeptide (TPR) repeat protein